MKTQELTTVPTGVSFRAKAEILDLERLGWDFYDLYMDVYLCHQDKYRAENELPKKSFDMDFTVEDAAQWEQENYHVEITVDENGSTSYAMCQHAHIGNETHGQGETGDDEKTIEDLNALLSQGLLWNIETDF